MKIILGIVVACVVLTIIGMFTGQPQQGAPPPAPTKREGPEPKLEITDVVVGKGATAVPGKTVSVHYTGTFTNGEQFDSSRDKGTPYSFVLGNGNVIAGWHQGIEGMKVGGKRKLVIPPQLAYGDAGYGKIPGGTTLDFDIELIEVK